MVVFYLVHLFADVSATFISVAGTEYSSGELVFPLSRFDVAMARRTIRVPLSEPNEDLNK